MTVILILFLSPQKLPYFCRNQKYRKILEKCVTWEGGDVFQNTAFLIKKIVSKHKNQIATLTSVQNKGKMSKIEKNVDELYKNMKMYCVFTSMHIEFLQRNSPELLKRILTYKKKNNDCYCYPENCHGDILIKILNQMVSYVNKYFNSRNISFWGSWLTVITQYLVCG